MLNPIKKRIYPELLIDPYNCTAEDLKAKFSRLEEDLYYLHLPFLDGFTQYLVKLDTGYRVIFVSQNMSEDHEEDIAHAKALWLKIQEQEAAA